MDNRSASSTEDWLVDRPEGTLEDAIKARDADVLAQWARYFRFGQEIGMRSLDGVCRVIEEIGYIFSGERFDETESVWNVAAEVARECGHGDRVAEVEASYKQKMADDLRSSLLCEIQTDRGELRTSLANRPESHE